MTKGSRSIGSPTARPAAAGKPKAIDAAVAHLARRELAQARAVSERILAASPGDVEATEILGIVHLQQGRPGDALPLLREVARARPRNIAALGNVCAVLMAQRQHGEALRTADAMLALDPASVTAHVSRGVALQGMGRQEDALASYQAAMARDPGNHDAANNAGTILGALGRHQESLECYERALASRPAFPEALNNRGVSLAALERTDEALASYAEALRLRPDYLDARKNTAELLARVGRNEEALAAYDAAIALAPDLAELVSNRSTVLNSLNRHAEALPGYDRALALKPQFTDAINNRGITLNALNRFDEALACFERAIALKPDYVNAHWNRSLTLLRLGRFAEGWPEHEWRWQKPEFAQHKLDLKQPLWQGREDLSGKTILLLAEQGYGDTLQFVRYVPLLEARGARVLLFVPEPVVGLLRQSFPNAIIFNRTDAFPPADFYCPLLSLPLAFGTLLETIPAPRSYIRPPPERLPAWAARVGPPGQPRVGVVWTGSASHRNDVNRSIALDAFAAILRVEGVRFFSLQKDLRDGEAARLAAFGNVSSLGPDLADFSDTAAAIAALDLVVAVDTSVAHLAAAMGKPTWVLLPFISDWRWLPGRATSPWYPAARLFWQPAIGNWDTAIAQVRDELARFRAEPAAATPADAPPAIGLDQAIAQATALLRAGNAADAEAISQGVLQLQPDHPDALMILGTIRMQQERTELAVELFRRASNRRPGSVEVLSNLAGALRRAERHEEAIAFYDRAIAIAPDSPNLHGNRGVSLLALRRYELAADSIDRALAIDSRNLSALNNRGVVLNELRRHEEALATFDRALEIKPDYVDAMNNRGLSLISLNRLDEAERTYRRTLEIKDRYADGLNNLGLALAGMNRNDEALDLFRKAQACKPGYIDAHWNEALINLVVGNYADGWKQYEWRWKKPEFAPHKREFHVPQWTGREPLEGRSFFLHAEQGFGDTIQFVRYIDLLQARGAKVIASLPETLRELMRESFPGVGFYCGSEALPPFDLHAPMLSMPLCFGTTVATIPSRSPYLQVPAARLDKWRARLGARDRPRVGIVWAGNPKHGNDRNRSLPATALARLFIDGVAFYGLQGDLRAGDEAALASQPIELLAREFNDFADTAAAIVQLDLVLSVDTSVAHLAGALGKPVWLLLPFATDWRWLVGRDDSPWYPSARLFRQPALGAVDALLANVRTALSAWSGQACGSSAGSRRPR